MNRAVRSMIEDFIKKAEQKVCMFFLIGAGSIAEIRVEAGQTIEKMEPGEPEAASHPSLRGHHVLTVLDSLLRSLQFARQFNCDLELRRRLWAAGFMKEKQTNPPELFYQEAHSLRLYLQVLLRMYNSAATVAGEHEGKAAAAADESALRVAVDPADDQAALLAHVLARMLGWRVARWLLRRRATPPQGSWWGPPRHANLRGALAVAPWRGPRGGPVPWSSGGRHGPRPPIWLVDDVTTSGATLEEARLALRARGLAVAGALVLARAGDPESVRAPSRAAPARLPPGSRPSTDRTA